MASNASVPLLRRIQLTKIAADLSDEDLVAAVRAGDESAFDGLVARHQERVYRLVHALCDDRRDAEEALQDTFLQVYRKLDGFRGASRFSTWLHRVATNCALMKRRARRRQSTESLEDYLPSFDETGQHARLDVDYSRVARADELLERRELGRAARQGLALLPEIYRTAVVLRDLQDLSTAEAAEVLGVEAATVRQRLHRGRLLLRGYLAKKMGEP